MLDHLRLSLMLLLLLPPTQARRQDSVTGGAEINFGGGTRSLFCVNSKGAQKIYPCLDQRNKVWCENSRNFPAEIDFKWFFRPKTVDLQKKKKKIQGIFRPRLEFQVVFLISSPQKTLIWASICAPKPRTY